MGQHVARAQDREQIRHLSGDSAEARLRGWRPHLLLEVRPVDLRQDRETAHVEQSVDLVDVRRLELELACEQVEHFVGHARVNLEPDYACVAAAPAQLGLDRREQILGVAVDVVQVAVACDAEGMVRDDLHARKQERKVQRDHVFERHVTLTFDQRDEARQDRRHLDPREALLAPLRVTDHHGEVQRKMRYVRKWVAGIDRERRQNRKDLLPEHGVELGELLLADLLAAHESDSRLRERRYDLPVIDRHLAIDQSFDPRADRLQLLERRHAVRRRDGDGGQDLLFEAGDADLEEVVQVLAEYGQEPHTFEEGELGIFGHRQHALIEVEPGKLAVDVAGADWRKNRRKIWLGVGSDGHETNFTVSIWGLDTRLANPAE